MSISKETNGTYTVSYTIRDMFTKTSKRTKKRGFKTLKEARDYDRSVERENSSIGFKMLFKQYLNSLNQNKDTKTDRINMYKRYLSCLDDMNYEDITKPYLINLRQYIDSLELSSIRKNKLLQLIKSTCKYANVVYDLPDNSKIMKNFRIEKKEMQIWSLDEFNKFISVCKDLYPNYYPFFHTLYWTGMRKGEARCLLTSDLDLDNKTISINKSMRRYRNSLKNTTKTLSGMRKVKLDTITLEILKPLKSNEKWLFGDYKPFNLNSIDHVFNECIKVANVKKIRIHDLRHSHASYLINNGANIVAVSKRLGHSSINTTLNTYTHILVDAENKLIDVINKQSSTNNKSL